MKRTGWGVGVYRSGVDYREETLNRAKKADKVKSLLTKVPKFLSIVS